MNKSQCTCYVRILLYFHANFAKTNVGRSKGEERVDSMEQLIYPSKLAIQRDHDSPGIEKYKYIKGNDF